MPEMLPDFLDFALNGFISLFPVIDPVSAILVFLTLAAGATGEVRRRVALRAALYSVLVLVFFLILGDGILLFFGISVATIKIAGGIVVFATGWETLNEKQGPMTVEAVEDTAEIDRDRAACRQDFAFIPLTVPMLAGPGAISVTVGLAAQAQENYSLARELNLLAIAIAIGCIGVSIYVCLRLANWCLNTIGESGLIALNRLIGLFILAFGVQLVLNGITDWLLDIKLV